MSHTFSKAAAFNADLSRWDVSGVKLMYRMFAGAKAFEQTLCGAAWVNSKATKVGMFTGSS